MTTHRSMRVQEVWVALGVLALVGLVCLTSLGSGLPLEPSTSSGERDASLAASADLDGSQGQSEVSRSNVTSAGGSAWTVSGSVQFDGGTPAAGIGVELRFGEDSVTLVTTEDGRFEGRIVGSSGNELGLTLSNPSGSALTRAWTSPPSDSQHWDLGLLVLPISRVRVTLQTPVDWSWIPSPLLVEVIAAIDTEGAAPFDARRNDESTRWVVRLDAESSSRMEGFLRPGRSTDSVVRWFVCAPGQIIPHIALEQPLEKLPDGTFKDSCLELTPEHFVIGSLNDAGGVGVEGATLSMTRSVATSPGQHLIKLRTVTEGLFLHPCRPGESGQVWFDARGIAESERVAWFPGVHANVPFAARHGVRVRVVDAEGRPVLRYGLLRRMLGGADGSRDQVLEMVVRECPDGRSVLKGRVQNGDHLFVVLRDGTHFEHVVATDAPPESYVLRLGSVIPVGVLQVMIGDDLLELAGQVRRFGPIVVDGKHQRRITIAPQEDAARVFRSWKIPAEQPPTEVTFRDLPVGTYRCCFELSGVVQFERWIEMRAGKTASVLLGSPRPADR